MDDRAMDPATTVADCQPRARHFLHSLDLTDDNKAKPAWQGGLFMLWASAQWQAFADEIGQPRDKLRNHTHGDAFDAWLEARCVCASPP